MLVDDTYFIIEFVGVEVWPPSPLLTVAAAAAAAVFVLALCATVYFAIGPRRSS